MKRTALILIVLLILIVPTGAVLAAPYFDTVVTEGETVDNDVIVFDGDLEIKDNATVNGDVIVFNGDARLAGTINGDLVIFNGDFETEGEARINGDCVLLNGSIDDFSDGGIRCTNIQGGAFPGMMEGLSVVPPVPVVPDAPAPPQPPDPPVRVDTAEHGRSMGFFADAVGAVGSSVIMGLLAFGVASLFPKQLQVTTKTLRQKPAVSGVVGLLTAVAVPSLVTLLVIISAILIIVCIGLLGFPLALLIMLALVAAVGMGWIATGAWLGGRAFGRKGRSFAFTTALGTAVLVLAINLIGIPLGFLEVILASLVSFIGLGAVALTQFGTKAYPRQTVEEQVVFEENSDKVSSVMETLHIDVEDTDIR